MTTELWEAGENTVNSKLREIIFTWKPFSSSKEIAKSVRLCCVSCWRQSILRDMPEIIKMRCMGRIVECGIWIFLHCDISYCGFHSSLCPRITFFFFLNRSSQGTVSHDALSRNCLEPSKMFSWFIFHVCYFAFTHAGFYLLLFCVVWRFARALCNFSAFPLKMDYPACIILKYPSIPLISSGCRYFQHL